MYIDIDIDILYKYINIWYSREKTFGIHLVHA